MQIGINAKEKIEKHGTFTKKKHIKSSRVLKKTCQVKKTML